MNLLKAGGLAAWFLALAYVVGIALNFTVLDTTSLPDPMDRLRFVVEHRGAFGGFTLGAYVSFGAALVIAGEALRKWSDTAPQGWISVATVYARIWAALLMGSGLVYLAGLQAVGELLGRDPSGALALWRVVEVVHQGLGCTLEIPGGLWIALASVSCGDTFGVPSWWKGIGLLAGATGILSVVPALFVPAVGLYVLSSTVWFVWLGMLLRRSFPYTSTRSLP